MTGWRAWALVLAVATGAPSSGPTAQPASPAMELERYPGGDPAKPPRFIEDLTHDQLATFIKKLRDEGRPWVEQGTDDARRRRLVFAAFVLDVADATSWWNRVEFEQEPSIRMSRAARPLIEEACTLLRAHPIGEPERQWMMASVAYGHSTETALLLSGRHPETHEVGIGHLAHVQAVFPEDFRLKLASAVTLEMADWALTGERVIAGTDELRAVPVESRRRIIQAMEALTKEPAVAAEAHLHIAFQQFLMNDADGALQSFKRASTAEDPYVQYLAFLLAGRMLDRFGQPADAEGSYRLALNALPRTKSGVESLAAKLMLRGDRAGAAALVDAMFAEPRGELDPWFLFALGDYRRLPEYMAAIRRGLVR